MTLPSDQKYVNTDAINESIDQVVPGTRDIKSSIITRKDSICSSVKLREANQQMCICRVLWLTL